MSTPHTVAILGSCATRDAFAACPRDDLHISDYTARTSLSSLAGAPHLCTNILDAISSSFQRRMVERDMRKSFWGLIGRGSTKTLILDFIDDRFDIAEFPNGGLNTLSAEYNKVRSHAAPRPVRRIATRSRKYLDLWKHGCDRLLAEAALQGIRVIVNRVYYLPTGDAAIDATAEIDEANEYLESRYYYLRALDHIEYLQPELQIDSAHKWGLSNFHYSKETYSAFMSKLQALLDGSKLSDLI